MPNIVVIDLKQLLGTADLDMTTNPESTTTSVMQLLKGMLNQLQENQSISTSVTSGQNAALTTTAAQLPALADLLKVTLVAPSANTAAVLIGDATNQYVSLAAGSQITLELSNLNQLYAKAASGTQGLTWVAITRAQV